MGVEYYAVCHTCRQFVDCHKAYLPTRIDSFGDGSTGDAGDWRVYWLARGMIFFGAHLGHRLDYVSEHSEIWEQGWAYGRRCYNHPDCGHGALECDKPPSEWNGYVEVMPHKEGQMWNHEAHERMIDLQSKWGWAEVLEREGIADFLRGILYHPGGFDRDKLVEMVRDGRASKGHGGRAAFRFPED